jgi:hypothetical protein
MPETPAEETPTFEATDGPYSTETFDALMLEMGADSDVAAVYGVETTADEDGPTLKVNDEKGDDKPQTLNAARAEFVTGMYADRTKAFAAVKAHFDQRKKGTEAEEQIERAESAVTDALALKLAVVRAEALSNAAVAAAAIEERLNSEKAVATDAVRVASKVHGAAKQATVAANQKASEALEMLEAVRESGEEVAVAEVVGDATEGAPASAAEATE